MYRPMRAETIQTLNEGIALLYRRVRPGGQHRYAVRVHPGDPYLDQQYVPIGPKQGRWAALVRLCTLCAYGRRWQWVTLPPEFVLPRHVNYRCAIVENAPVNTLGDEGSGP